MMTLVSLVAACVVTGTLRPVTGPQDSRGQAELESRTALVEFLETPGVRDLVDTAWYEAVEKLQEENTAGPREVLDAARREPNRSFAAALLFLARSLGASRESVKTFLGDSDPDVVTAAALAMETPVEDLDLTSRPTGRRSQAAAWEEVFFHGDLWSHTRSSMRPRIESWTAFRSLGTWREEVVTFFRAEHEVRPRPAEWVEIRAELLRVRSSLVLRLILDNHAAPDFRAMAATVARDPSESTERRVRAVDALSRTGIAEDMALVREQLHAGSSVDWVDALFWRARWKTEAEAIEFLDTRIESASDNLRSWAMNQRIWLAAGRRGTASPQDPAFQRSQATFLKMRLYQRPFSATDHAWLTHGMRSSSLEVAHLALGIVARARAEGEFRDALAAVERLGASHVVRARAGCMLDRAR